MQPLLLRFWKFGSFHGSFSGFLGQHYEVGNRFEDRFVIDGLFSFQFYPTFYFP
jgi:hypothetical protein